MLRPSPTAAVLLGLMAALAAGASSAAPSTTAPMGFGDARVLLHERADIMAADRAEIARAESEAEAAKSLSGPKSKVKAVEFDLPVIVNVPPVFATDVSAPSSNETNSGLAFCTT